jgi:hypothetical protein
MKGLGLCALALGLFFAVLVCSAVPTAAQFAANCSPECYGARLASDGLANTVVGGQYGIQVSYRFRAERSGRVEKLHLYLIPDKVGYAAGTGGVLQITVNADDGSSAHNPSSTVLGSHVVTNAIAATPSRYFPIFTLSSPPMLTAGQLYHIVFKNVDASPTTNYLSVDALYQQYPPTPSQPTVADADLAVLMKSAAGAWKVRSGYTPIYQLDYEDGASLGIGYMEAWVGAPRAISGTNAVRQMLAVTGETRNVSGVAVRVARVAGSAPLVVRLENADGSVIEEGEIPAGSIALSSPLKYVWARYAFSAVRSLQPGQTYYLALYSASGTTYQAFPIRKGMHYGFRNTTYFPNGHAQFRQGSAWTGWTQWGATNRTDGDLQFFFEPAGNEPPPPPPPPAPEPPVISNVSAGSITMSGATITWQTDQASTTQVEYGTTASYGSVTALDTDMVSSHSRALAGLNAGTVYYFRVRSRNADGLEAISGSSTFTTSAAPPPSGATLTVNFDDLAGNRNLTGWYPASLINWGTAARLYVWGPVGLFTTKNIRFRSGYKNSTVTLASPYWLASVQAYNRSSNSTTVTISCSGQPTAQVMVTGKQLVTINTNWSVPCSTVTVASTNGSLTSFDNFVVRQP